MFVPRAELSPPAPARERSLCRVLAVPPPRADLALPLVMALSRGSFSHRNLGSLMLENQIRDIKENPQFEPKLVDKKVLWAGQEVHK